MNVCEAAIQILTDSGEPLHADELTKRILEKRLWSTPGKTPCKTVAARLYKDIKEKGDASPFVKVAPMTFGLRRVGTVPAALAKKAIAQARSNRTSTKTYPFKDAAKKVLEQFGGKKPMHYRDITQKALEQGWLVTGGKTPEATMHAELSREVRRHQERGEQPRFVMHGGGYVGLSCWMGRGLASEIELHNRKVRKSLLKQLHAMKWDEFEELVARLFAEMGLEEIEVTGPGSDRGIDVRGTLVVGEVIRTRMAVQVKKWKKNVQAPVVQQLRGSLGVHEQGLIITTSDFSPGARREAARSDTAPVALMNGEHLVLLLVENEIGVIRHPHILLDLSPGW